MADMQMRVSQPRVLNSSSIVELSANRNPLSLRIVQVPQRKACDTCCFQRQSQKRPADWDPSNSTDSSPYS